MSFLDGKLSRGPLCAPHRRNRRLLGYQIHENVSRGPSPIHAVCLLCVVCLLLTGCANRSYSGELLERLTTENCAEADKWFAANMPDVENRTAEVYRDMWQASNCVTGTFEKDGKVITYYLNPFTGQCCTDECIYMVKDKLAQLYIEATGYAEDCEKVIAYTSDNSIGCEFSGTNVLDRPQNSLARHPSNGEIEYREFTDRIHALDITESQAEALKLAEDVYNHGSYDVEITAKSFENIEERWRLCTDDCPLRRNNVFIEIWSPVDVPAPGEITGYVLGFSESKLYTERLTMGEDGFNKSERIFECEFNVGPVGYGRDKK